MSETAENLEQHIEACLKGNPDSFEEIVKLCEPKVRAVIAAMSPDPNIVEDLTQDAFVIAYQKLDTYQPGTNFMAWIRTIARNVAQNSRRRWYRRQDAQKHYEAEAERTLAENIDKLIDSLPEETLESLRDCVGGLNGKMKQLVDGYYYESCSLKTVAELLNISSSAAKVTLHRARQALGNCLQHKGGE